MRQICKGYSPWYRPSQVVTDNRNVRYRGAAHLSALGVTSARIGAWPDVLSQGMITIAPGKHDPDEIALVATMRAPQMWNLPRTA